MIPKPWQWSVAIALAAFGLTGTAIAQQRANARGAIVEEVRNPNQAFQVRVSVDHPNQVYIEDETLTVTVRSSDDGYLYLLYQSADGEVKCLFPNKFQEDNRIVKNVDTVVPPAMDATFRIRIAAPFGKEYLKAVVTKQRLRVDDERLRRKAMSPIEFATVKDAVVEAVGETPTNWAEHSVQLTTVAKDKERIARRPRRIGLFIGIGAFLDPTIRPLPACVADARQMHDTMRRFGGLDDAFLLLNDEATLRNIVEHIQGRLVDVSLPGDTVFIYWSGHGGRCADNNGDEADGLDEYLVAYDTKVNDAEMVRRTALMDDHCGRLLQDLDGRKIVVILDTCHSGGQAANEKGLRSLNKVKVIEALDLFNNELRHMKDIGQKETALLMSSRAAQVSFVRKQGDLSVMTKFLDEMIREAAGPLTLVDAAAKLKELVPAYVAEQFPAATQTPELVDNTSPPLFLRK
jgi:hypothetical protein